MGRLFLYIFPRLKNGCRRVVTTLFESMDHGNELDDFSNKVKDESKTSKVWIDCLVRPLFLMMIYVCAEGEGK